MCRDMACIESFVSNADPEAAPVMEFYETSELRGQLDNWSGPNVACLMAFTRTAGFARARFEGTAPTQLALNPNRGGSMDIIAP